MSRLMETEVEERIGERSRQQEKRKANRWGSARGYCVVMGRRWRSNGRGFERPTIRKYGWAVTRCSTVATR
jgi:hypothetical protein